MNVAVVGLWHLGCVTAACLAKGDHHVIGFDPHPETVQSLKLNKAPLFEPGLDELITKGTTNKTLSFTLDAKDIATADVIWVTFDTPVDDQDIADVEFVLTELKAVLM